MVTMWGETAIGRDHMENGDVIFFPGAGRDPLDEERIAARGRLMAIASGRGGPDVGRPAARAAIAALVPAYYSSADTADGLRQGLVEAGAAVAAVDARAATHLIAGVIDDDKLYLALAGEGRAYRLRGGTVELLADGRREHAPRLPLGPGEAPVVYEPILLEPADRVWLTSEALGAALDDVDWTTAIGRGDPRRISSRPIAVARERVSPGDLSLVLAAVGDVTSLSTTQWVVLVALGVAALAAMGWLVYELARMMAG